MLRFVRLLGGALGVILAITLAGLSDALTLVAGLSERLDALEIAAAMAPEAALVSDPSVHYSPAPVDFGTGEYRVPGLAQAAAAPSPSGSAPGAPAGTRPR